jgi:tetratricopeptide (TPR) repeat protein
MHNQEIILKKAAALIEKKNYTEAKSILLGFIENIKNIKIDNRFYYYLYLVFDGLREAQKAKKYLEKYLKINSNNHIALNNLANIFLKEKNIIKAEKFYLKSIENKNDYLIAIINIAIFYQEIGRLEDSKKFYLKAINLSPKRISIYYNLSKIDKEFIDEKKLKYLSDIINNDKIELLDMAYGYFLLAEHERKKNFFKRELDLLKKAHRYLFEAELNINNQSLNYWLNVISKKYNSFSFIKENKKNELINMSPIFIIGLPRSGSTIVETMLSSGNSKVENLGETNILNGVVVSTHNALKNNENSKIDLELINNTVLKLMRDRNFLTTNSKVFTDKSLENFLYIDIILKIFPKAKFVNTFRNIEDNIFAIFQLPLPKISWTNSIESILNYVDNYLKIIKYFKNKYPDQILSLDLEELTKKPEEISKKLFSFCNLKWNEEVLNFYNRKDLHITTASNIQVRKKINKYDYEKYRYYKEFLKAFSGKYDWIG